jgi:serine/threonine-protein phosphatase 2A regulatory subunit B''
MKLVEKIEGDKIPKQTFISFWKKHLENESVAKRVFKLFAQPGSNYIVPSDFKALFKNLLETHPGLEFLQATPEFQERYADTVVMRIFFSLDSNDDGKITWRDFKNSNLLETFF